MSPGDKKVRAILEFPTPKNVADARSFHGLASFFRRFIPGFAGLCAPIIELFKKDTKFVWQEKQNKAFQKITSLIGASPILPYYNPKATRTELHTDASAIGLGAMLLQEDEEKVLRLVYAISRRTSDVEKSYHSSKLELMGIVWAMERLRPFLIGIPFTVITDCQALVHINTYKTKNHQIIRWQNLLADYEFEIVHRSGDRMQHVDACSVKGICKYPCAKSKTANIVAPCKSSNYHLDSEVESAYVSCFCFIFDNQLQVCCFQPTLLIEGMD